MSNSWFWKLGRGHKGVRGEQAQWPQSPQRLHGALQAI
jgi:hypothetical protein